MVKKYLIVIITAFIVASSNSFADDFNKRGYVTLRTLHNINLLYRPNHAALVDLKKFESIDDSSSKKAASSIQGERMSV